jgi:hypothetical protein
VEAAQDTEPNDTGHQLHEDSEKDAKEEAGEEGQWVQVCSAPLLDHDPR